MKTVVDLVTALKTYFIGKDTTSKQAVEANIAPVETDATSASNSYAVGAQLILNDILYDVTAAITAGDPLETTGAGANISAADDVTSQIKGLKPSITDKTLAASATSVEFDVPTTGNHLIEFFCSDGADYTAIDTSVSGKVTLTYDAVSSARTVTCKISEG